MRRGERVSAKDRRKERENGHREQNSSCQGRSNVELRFHVYPCRLLVLVFHFFFSSLSLPPSRFRIPSHAERKKTDRRGNIVRGSAAAAYQDAVVNVSEIIMWCDVSQVSFARGSAAHRSLTIARRPAAVLFSRNPLYPLRARICAPPYVRCSLLSAFRVYDTRAAFPRFAPFLLMENELRDISRAVPRLSKNDDRERARTLV